MGEKRWVKKVWGNKMGEKSMGENFAKSMGENFVKSMGENFVKSMSEKRWVKKVWVKTL